MNCERLVPRQPVVIVASGKESNEEKGGTVSNTKYSKPVHSCPSVYPFVCVLLLLSIVTKCVPLCIHTVAYVMTVDVELLQGCQSCKTSSTSNTGLHHM